MIFKNPFKKQTKSLNIENNVPSEVVFAIPINYQTPNLPVYYDFEDQMSLMKAYENNPILQAVIDIRANAYANGRIYAKDLKTGEIIKDFSASKNEKLIKLNKILNNPNPLQTRKGLFSENKIYKYVFGMSYLNRVCSDIGHPIDSLQALNNLPPYLIQTQVTGKYFKQTKLDEVLTKYQLQLTPSNTLEFSPIHVLTSQEPNIRFDQQFFKGKSKLKALNKIIKNIDLAIEAINVLMQHRGAIGFYSSDVKDANGSMPLTDIEKKDVQSEFKKYGILEGQQSHILTKVPLRFQRTAMTPDELGIYKEIEKGAILISNAFGVPPELTKNYIEGATFENQIQSVRRLYQDTIIPESEDDWEAFNQWMRMEEIGLKLFISYDHIPAMQENKKEEAVTLLSNEKAFMSAFLKGAITYNIYLNAIGLPADKEIGDKRIWNLTPEQILIIQAKASQAPGGTGI